MFFLYCSVSLFVGVVGGGGGGGFFWCCCGVRFVCMCVWHVCVRA